MIVTNQSNKEFIKLDFEQARARHLLFKSRLRSILYGIEIDEAPVVSHFECAVGKWIYGHALQVYGHIAEMVELEKVHADIHISAKGLVELYKAGKIDEARKGLGEMENIADHLVRLLSIIEIKLKETPSLELETKEYGDVLNINLKELYELQRVNYELDVRIKEQSSELLKAKERFELLAKATQDAVWDWDLLNNTIWWNEGFKEMFGYKNEEILPGIESWYNGIHPEDRERVVNGIHQVIDNGGSHWSDEYRFKRADNTYAYIYDRGYAFHDSEGKPYRMVGSMQDITVERESKEALNRAQSQLQMALSAGLVSTFFWDIQKDLFYADANLALLFAVSPEEAAKGLPLKILLNAIHDDDKERVAALINKAIETGEDYEADYRVRNAAGEICWVIARGRVNYNKEGKPLSFPGTLVDITERKSAEELAQLAVQESEKQKRLLEALNGATPDLVYVFDLNYRFTYANEALLRMWGRSWEDSIGKGLLELGYEPWHAEMHEREIDQVVATKMPIRGTVSFPHAELGIRVYDYIFAPVLNQKGEVEAIAGTTRDISDLKLAEEALKASEQRFRSILVQAPDPILILKGENMVLEIANKPLFNIWNVDETALGKPFLDILPEMKAQGFLEMLQDVYFNDKVVKGYETPAVFTRKNGQKETVYFNFIYQPYREADGVISGVMVIATDVTPQVLARQKITESEEQFRSLTESLPQLIWTTDRNGSADFFNQQWYEYTGSTDKESFGNEWAQFVHPDHLEPLLLKWQNSLASGEPILSEFQLKNKYGNYRWFYVLGNPVKDENGTIVKWVGALTNIDERKNLEQELERRVEERTKALQETNQMLERSNAELEQFAYVTSHDLQEPLRKIQVFNNLLIEKCSDCLNEEAWKYVGKISDSAKRMTGQIKDLLNFSRLSQSVMDYEEVDLNLILQEVLKDVEVLIEQKEAVVHSDPLPTIKAAPLQMTQLFYNLISNSLKFAKKNSTPMLHITVAGLSEEKRDQYLELETNKEYYQINFRDNGIGFNQDYAEKIFTIFQRLNGRNLYEGYGIGLAICKKVIINHKGIIFAQGEEGKGASFTVILPSKQ
jgi:PAS domain S-box-containing protein